MENEDKADTLEIHTEFYGSNKGQVPIYLIRAGLYTIGGLFLACIFRKIMGLYIPTITALCMLAVFAAILCFGLYLRMWSRYEVTFELSPDEWQWETPEKNNMILSVWNEENRELKIPVFKKVLNVVKSGGKCEISGKASAAFKESIKNTIGRHYGEQCRHIYKVCAKTKNQ